MRSRLTDEFVRLFHRLPRQVQDVARKNYRLWLANPSHPSLQFKRVHPVEPIYSVRIGRGWRALAIIEHDTATWFWIGSHSEYDQMISTI